MPAPKMRMSSVDSVDFARSVAKTPDKQLAEGMRGELRGEVLDEVFGRMERHFEPARADGVNTVVRWRICGRADGDCDSYEMIIRNGVCQVIEGEAHKPRVTLTVDPVSFLKLVTGNARSQMLMLRGKLKARGDILLARRLEGWFSIPRGA